MDNMDANTVGMWIFIIIMCAAATLMLVGYLIIRLNSRIGGVCCGGERIVLPKGELEKIAMMNDKPVAKDIATTSDCVKDRELTFREKMKLIEDENSRWKKEIDDEYQLAKKKIDEDCVKIDQDLHQAFTDLKDTMVECVRFGNREQTNSFSSTDSGGFNN